MPAVKSFAGGEGTVTAYVLLNRMTISRLEFMSSNLLTCQIVRRRLAPFGLFLFAFLAFSFCLPRALGQSQEEYHLCSEAIDALQVTEDFLFPKTEEFALRVCDNSNIAYKTTLAIAFIKSTAKSLGPGLLSPSEYADPYKYIKERIYAFDFDANCPSDRKAYVSSMDEKKVMHVCTSALTIDVVGLSSLIIHEARHVDGDQFKHRICLRGAHVDSESCDGSLLEKGAYAFQADYLLRLANSKTLNNDIRENARAGALTILSERFNQLPPAMLMGTLL